MPASTLYWLTLISLGLCVLLSLLRRQTATRLATAQRQLLEERKDRERAMSELIHVQSSRAAAEKEAEAAKKDAAEAAKKEVETKASLGPQIEKLEALTAQLEQERDAANAARDASARALEEKTKAEALAQSTVTVLAREAEESRSLASANQGKVTTLEGKIPALEGKIAALEEELAKVKSAAAATPPPPAVAPASVAADFLVALDADPYTNRGQKETIRMTYTQFTAKKRPS